MPTPFNGDATLIEKSRQRLNGRIDTVGNPGALGTTVMAVLDLDNTNKPLLAGYPPSLLHR